jgi:MFS family permease
MKEKQRSWGRVLAGTVVGSACGISALLLYTNGLFVAGLARDFGLTRTQFGFGVLLVTLALAAANPLVGWAVDRFSARLPAILGLLLLSVGFASLGMFVFSVNSYLIVQCVVAFVGAASGPIAYTKIIGATFSRNRGLALGATMTGIGLSAAAIPPLLASIIASHGWRAGFFVLAVIPLVGVLATALLIPRGSEIAQPDRSTARGSEVATPPGTAAARGVEVATPGIAASRGAEVATPGIVAARGAEAARPDVEAAHGGGSLDVADAPLVAPGSWARSRVFWVMTAAFATMSLSFAGLLPHFVPMLIDGGLNPVAAGSVAGYIGLAVIGSRLLIGFLLDRLFAPRIAIAICVIAASGFVILVVQGISAAAATAITLGFAMGAELDLMGFLVARYFGLAEFGRIYGWLYGAFIFASGLGPLWVGALRDATGNYTLALEISVAGLLVACIGFLLLPRYDAKLPSPVAAIAS